MTGAPTGTALLLVDLQRDYLDRPGLVPAEADLIVEATALLEGFRAAGLPVAHVRTLVRPDGTDAMPHWRAAGTLACVEGTPGAAPPAALREHEGELVARKQHYRGFADPALDAWLRARDVAQVVIAGLYTHACVRETALDAYERGYEVVIASDAVGTDSPEHADLTHAWLSGRAARFLCVAEIVGTLPAAPATPSALVRHAAAIAADRQRAWQGVPSDVRAELLDAWADLLVERATDLEQVIVAEVAKPVGAARDEVRRAIGHVRTAAQQARAGLAADEQVAAGVTVRHAPIGVVGAITPWNNPAALPCAKIAPALAFGNAVVLKPAPEAVTTARLLMTTLHDAGLPAGLVTLVEGGATTGAAVVEDPDVSAVAITGSIATGRAIARRCTELGKPVQAELGGNNAAIVLPDADLDAVVPALARNAYAYSGQRCTAIRRFVVHASIADAFEGRMVDAIADLAVGDPADEATDVGPLISTAARDRVASAVADALVHGAVLLAGGGASHLDHDAFHEPTLLRVADATSAIVQEETFGPVAVVQWATDLDEAIDLANGVEQGLLLAVCTADASTAAAVLDRARTGIAQWGPGLVPVHADAPFGGWKASGFGPPEHGRWDLQFLTRPQARYRPVG